MSTSRTAALSGPELPAFRRILCALDVQRPAPGATALASLIARQFEAELEALYVSPGPFDPEAEARLERLVASLEPSVAGNARVAFGAPAASICERATERGCDLIVLGSRFRSDLGWQFRDDVVRDVSATTSSATLSVHDRDRAAAVERILVPVDFGPATSRMVDWASSFALRFGAEVQLLHVVSRERSAPRKGDRAALEELEARVAALGVKVGSQVLVAGNIAGGIEGYNESCEFDLVVMGMGQNDDARARVTRGVVATLRNRLSVPLLSVHASPFDATRPRVRSASLQREESRSPRVSLADRR
ncbi:MAG: universal stress protein [Myxococcales bacterium]|nr:MAG: universal stress protein [Myxococcales bacterium]